MDTFKQFVDVCAAHPARTIIMTAVALWAVVLLLDAAVTEYLEYLRREGN